MIAFWLVVVALGLVFGLRFLDATVSDFPSPEGRWGKKACVWVCMYIYGCWVVMWVCGGVMMVLFGLCDVCVGVERGFDGVGLGLGGAMDDRSRGFNTLTLHANSPLNSTPYQPTLTPRLPQQHKKKPKTAPPTRRRRRWCNTFRIKRACWPSRCSSRFVSFFCFRGCVCVSPLRVHVCSSCMHAWTRACMRMQALIENHTRPTTSNTPTPPKGAGRDDARERGPAGHGARAAVPELCGAFWLHLGPP